jgi:ketosteroid isomerase-like protein
VLAQSDEASQAAIRNALTGWMADFNAGKAATICDLFDRELRYDYRGFPERGYEAICELLHRSLADRSRRYAYGLDIKEIIVSGDLAVVRLVWTLKITRPGAPDIAADEPGLDVFRRQPDGSWKIIRYIAYEAP